MTNSEYFSAHASAGLTLGPWLESTTAQAIDNNLFNPTNNTLIRTLLRTRYGSMEIAFELDDDIESANSDIMDVVMATVRANATSWSIRYKSAMALLGMSNSDIAADYSRTISESTQQVIDGNTVSKLNRTSYDSVSPELTNQNETANDSTSTGSMTHTESGTNSGITSAWKRFADTSIGMTLFDDIAKTIALDLCVITY